jgi:hypothetical protein
MKNNKEVETMFLLLKTGETTETPVKEYYVESEAEIANIPDDAPTGSRVLVLTEGGLNVKMKNSQGKWIAI